MIFTGIMVAHTSVAQQMIVLLDSTDLNYIKRENATDMTCYQVTMVTFNGEKKSLCHLITIKAYTLFAF